MDSKLKNLRYITYALEIILLYVISGVPGLLPSISGTKPLLLLPVAVTIAVFEKEVPAMIFGLSCGALCDLGFSDKIGFYTIALTLLCFAFGYCARNFFVTNFANAMAIGGTTVVVLLCIHFLIYYANGDFPNAGAHFLRHYLVKILYTGVFLPPLFFLNRLLRSTIDN